MSKRIIVTGGSGKAGKHIITHLISQGHEVLNLDLVPLAGPLADKVHTLHVDLTNTGQVYSALTSHFHLSEPFREPLTQVADAIIHLAAHARNMIVADNETFRGNALSTYNVIEAACRLGIKKIITASTICVYGVGFAEGDVDFPAFPVDEELDVNPMDTYAISKMCGERISRGFVRRFGVNIYVLRIGRLVEAHEYAEAMFDSYVKEPHLWKVHGWSYADARDLAQMCERAVFTDGLGFQVFNATNDEITNFSTSTMDFLKEQCPNVPFTRDLEAREAPISNRKTKALLGFRQQHSWQKYYPKAQE
ncbi:hypothetical protein BDV59DRAFT_207050 [Aspergillus ambiguus]|uniref:NAD-dependent epimerase/dehydratase family protein n=1 Tax=Aspergillus ambiguus TaxID=176160 RepID=UPI003CCD0E0C